MFPIIPANTSGPSGNQGILGFGWAGPVTSYVSTTNLVSNAGVVSADIAGVPVGKSSLAACEYGTDTGIYGFGSDGSAISTTNLVSNLGVVAADTTGVGTARYALAACVLEVIKDFLVLVINHRQLLIQH